MKARSFLQSHSIIYVCAIIGAFASLISGMPLVMSILLAAIGLYGTLLSLAKSDAKERDIDLFLETSAKLLATQGMGNIYIQAFESELRKTGSCKRAIEILRKALEINPNDKDAIVWLSISYALSLSFHQWVGIRRKPAFDNDLFNIEQLTKKGLKLFPNEPVLHDAMGIILDVNGSHKSARKEFARSGKLRTDPFWHLLVSTSWLMDGNADKAVEEVEAAISAGAKAYIVDFYYGRALCAAGYFEKAQCYLESARITRKWRPELLTELKKCYYWQAKWFGASKYAAFSGLALLRFAKIRGLLDLLMAFGCVILALYCDIAKKLWPFLQKPKWLRRFAVYFFSPDQPEFTIAGHLVRDGHYNAAEHLLRKACKAWPDNARSFSNLAISLCKQGKINDALSACDRAIELEPDNEALRHNRVALELSKSQNSIDGCIIEVD